MCDVEGYEEALLDPAAVPALRSAWVLVEVHEFARPDVTNLLRQRFEPTHRVSHVWQTDRTHADYPFRGWFTRLLPRAYVTYLVHEHRPARMSWLWLEPQTAGGGREPS